MDFFVGVKMLLFFGGVVYMGGYFGVLVRGFVCL